MKGKTRGFDPEGSGYDMPRAKAAGMKRSKPKAIGQMKRKAKGHMGSVAPATASQQKRLGLPEGSYVILKGAKHPTFDKAVAGEKKRGSEVVKRGARYYSVPRINRQRDR